MRALSAALLLFLPGTAAAADLEAATATYQRLLSTYVEDGRVDYARLGADDSKALDRYLEAIAEAELPDDRGRRIGLLVDAYNATVLRSVIRHGRPRSVLDIDGFFDRETHRIAGRDLTLDALEKKVLNPYAKDPRTHFVLVCAAVGCPVLESKPFFGSDVDTRMEAATVRYLRSPTGARRDGERLLLSKIFDWYAADFGGADGVRRFVKDRLPSRLAPLARSGEVGFLDYNWTLNQQ